MPGNRTQSRHTGQTRAGRYYPTSPPRKRRHGPGNRIPGDCLFSMHPAIPPGGLPPAPGPIPQNPPALPACNPPAKPLPIPSLSLPACSPEFAASSRNSPANIRRVCAVGWCRRDGYPYIHLQTFCCVVVKFFFFYKRGSTDLCRGRGPSNTTQPGESAPNPHQNFY